MKGLCGQEIAGQKDSRDRERGRRASWSRLEYLIPCGLHWGLWFWGHKD